MPVSVHYHGYNHPHYQQHHSTQVGALTYSTLLPILDKIKKPDEDFPI